MVEMFDLKKSRAEDDEREAEEEGRLGGHGQAEVARGDDDAADDDRAVGADEAVGEIAASSGVR